MRLSYPQGDTSRYASVFWSRNFGRNWAANLSGNQNLDVSSDRSLYLSVSTTLDGLRQASASMQRNGNRTGFVADIANRCPAMAIWVASVGACRAVPVTMPAAGWPNWAG